MPALGVTIFSGRSRPLWSEAVRSSSLRGRSPAPSNLVAD